VKEEVQGWRLHQNFDARRRRRKRGAKGRTSLDWVSLSSRVRGRRKSSFQRLLWVEKVKSRRRGVDVG